MKTKTIGYAQARSVLPCYPCSISRSGNGNTLADPYNIVTEVNKDVACEATVWCAAANVEMNDKQPKE